MGRGCRGEWRRASWPRQTVPWRTRGGWRALMPAGGERSTAAMPSTSALPWYTSRDRGGMFPGGWAAMSERSSGLAEQSGWRSQAREGKSDDTLGFSQRRPAARYRVARKDRPHRRLEDTSPRPAHGTAPQHRWRWAGGLSWAWRRAPGRLRLSARLLSLLAKRAWSKRFHLWAVWGEFHCGRPVRPRGVHWRPLPGGWRFVRGDTAARHLLPGGHPDERAADGGAAGRARPTRFLSPCYRGGRSGNRRRDRADRDEHRAHDCVRDQCAAVHARSPSQAAGARAAHSGAESRLARLLPGAARARAERGDNGKRGAGSRVRPAPGVDRVPPAACVAQDSRE